jgi:hypothetical protein
VESAKAPHESREEEMSAMPEATTAGNELARGALRQPHEFSYLVMPGTSPGMADNFSDTN